jgi:acyl carrier protein
MSDEQIIEKLSAVFQEILGVQRFHLDIEMEEVQEWDSLRHIQLLAAIEEAFGIEIPFEEAIEMISGEEIIKKVKKYICPS